MRTSAEAHAEAERGWGLTHAGRLAYIEERLGLSGPTATPGRQARRASTYVLIAWVVPLVLSLLLLPSHLYVSASPEPLVMSFLGDAEAEVRGLVAIPLLVVGEWQIERHIRAALHRFGAPPLMRPTSRAGLARRIAWARHVVSHPFAEACIVMLALANGYRWLLAHEVAYATWIAVPSEAGHVVTAAGAWEAGVVIPIYTFLLARWLWRWIVLGLLFARISFLRLRIVPNHGDRAGGVGFVSKVGLVFGWVVVATSALGCGKAVNETLYDGVPANHFLSMVQSSPAIAIAVAFLPAVAFSIRLGATKARAIKRYRALVARHGIAMEKLWLQHGLPVSGSEAGSMADLNRVFAVVRKMRLVPASAKHLLAIALFAVVPLTPIFAMIVPLGEVLAKAVKSLL